MTALVAKADISGTPSRATANAGLGNLWEFVDERFSTGDGTAAEKAATRNALEATRTISPIEATVAANALTIAIKPNATEFRSATLNNGAVTILTNAADLTLVVPNGATLGAANGALTRLAVLEINNAGTKEAAVVNLLGGVNLDERGVISTTTISTGADSSQVIYSTTGRTNVPYRIVGFIESTQSTAGTYATAPSLVNGSSSPLAVWLSGYGQAWQNVTGSRAASTDYTNSTGRKIEVSIVAITTTGNIQILINGTTYVDAGQSSSGGVPCAVSATIQPGDTYQLFVSGSLSSLSNWAELR